MSGTAAAPIFAKDEFVAELAKTQTKQEEMIVRNMHLWAAKIKALGLKAAESGACSFSLDLNTCPVVGEFGDYPIRLCDGLQRVLLAMEKDGWKITRCKADFGYRSVEFSIDGFQRKFVAPSV